MHKKFKSIVSESLHTMSDPIQHRWTWMGTWVCQLFWYAVAHALLRFCIGWAMEKSMEIQWNGTRSSDPLYRNQWVHQWVWYALLMLCFDWVWAGPYKNHWKSIENAQEVQVHSIGIITHNEWPNTASMDLDGHMSLSIVLVCLCSCSASILYWLGHKEINEKAWKCTRMSSP